MITDGLYGRDADAYYEWLEKHKNASALIADSRHGYIIKAIYNCPQSMAITEGLDFFKLVGALQDAENEE